MVVVEFVLILFLQVPVLLLLPQVFVKDDVDIVNDVKLSNNFKTVLQLLILFVNDDVENVELSNNSISSLSFSPPFRWKMLLIFIFFAFFNFIILFKMMFHCC